MLRNEVNMSTAMNDRLNGQKTVKNPPIIIPEVKDNCGTVVWCGNNAINQYIQNKINEHRASLRAGLSD